MKSISAKYESTRKETSKAKDVQEEGYSTSSETDTSSELDNIADLKEKLKKKNGYIKQILEKLEVNKKLVFFIIFCEVITLLLHKHEF